MNAPDRWQQRPARHLNADTLDPPRRSRLGDAVLIGFGILVLAYFIGEFARLIPWKAIFG